MTNNTLVELVGCRENLVTGTDDLLVRCADVGGELKVAHCCDEPMTLGPAAIGGLAKVRGWHGAEPGSNGVGPLGL